MAGMRLGLLLPWSLSLRVPWNAKIGEARQSTQGKAGQGRAGQGRARQGTARQGKTSPDKIRQGVNLDMDPSNLNASSIIDKNTGSA